jgi:hypothetical protein
MSLNTVMKPHRKNSEVMTANEPRWFAPLPEFEDTAVAVEIDAIYGDYQL